MKDYTEFLKRELVPALGCTEPIALAYCAAVAGAQMKDRPDRMEAIVSRNIYKNAHSVTVPACGGRRGLEIALVAGCFLGHPEKKLELLTDIDQDRLEEMDEKIRSGFVHLSFHPKEAGVYVEVKLFNAKEHCRVVLSGAHDHISRIEYNDRLVKEDPLPASECVLEEMSFQKILDFANHCDYRPLQEVLDRQIECNLKVAEQGLAGKWGCEIGRTLVENYADYEDRLVAYGAAGSDARMGGCELPVVINAGSGNQGITVSVPLTIYARDHEVDQETFYRGLILANLLSLYIKQGVGKLSAYCGAVSAASANAVGIAYLKGDSEQVMKDTLSNALAVNSGILCDGAKASCAMKIASSLRNAFLALKQAERGTSFQKGDGMVKGDVDEMVRSVGIIAREGMEQTDQVLLNVMMGD